jgi:hypothetical protein
VTYFFKRDDGKAVLVREGNDGGPGAEVAFLACVENGLPQKMPGSHLVFVKTKTDPYNLYQWIYNGADLDGSRFVWARDLGNEENARLARYMQGRSVWLVNPNVEAKSGRMDALPLGIR